MKIKLTKNKQDIEKYQELRQNIFNQENGWKVDKISKFDKDGHIFVAKVDNEIVGGVRILLSTECKIMSNEDDNYKYSNLEELNYDYAEINDIIIKQENRGKIIIKDLSRLIIEFCKQKNIKAIFMVACKKRLRLYKMIFNSFGLKSKIYDKKWSCLEYYNYSNDYPMITFLK